jgi:hypothetical protein
MPPCGIPSMKIMPLGQGDAVADSKPRESRTLQSSPPMPLVRLATAGRNDVETTGTRSLSEVDGQGSPLSTLRTPNHVTRTPTSQTFLPAAINAPVITEPSFKLLIGLGSAKWPRLCNGTD